MQDSPTENAYLSAISSHFSYWANADTALFVLRAVNDVDVINGPVKEDKDVKEVPPQPSSAGTAAVAVAGAAAPGTADAVGSDPVDNSPEAIVDARWLGSSKQRQLHPVG